MTIPPEILNIEGLREELGRLNAERNDLLNALARNRDMKNIVMGALATLTHQETLNEQKKGSPHVDQTN